MLLPMLGACFMAMLVPTLLRDAPIYNSLGAHAGARKNTPGGGNLEMRSTVWTDARSNGEPRLSEYVRDITAFVLHFEQSGGRIFVGAAGYLLINLRQNLPNRRAMYCRRRTARRSLPADRAHGFFPARAKRDLLHDHRRRDQPERADAQRHTEAGADRCLVDAEFRLPATLWNCK